MPADEQDEGGVLRYLLIGAAALGALGAVQTFIVGPVAADVTSILSRLQTLEGNREMDLDRTRRFRDERRESDEVIHTRLDEFSVDDVEWRARTDEKLARLRDEVDSLRAQLAGLHPRVSR